MPIDADEPTITIIVPMYNVEGYVGVCLESIRHQTFASFEVLVIDDGSTDRSVAEARTVIDADSRFSLIQQENRGLSAARNVGLDAARGEFIAFVDSDDRVAPNYLARLHDVLTTYDGDWVACALKYVTDQQTEATHSTIHGAGNLEPYFGVASYALQDWRQILRHFPSAWNKLYRRQLIGTTRFDEGLIFEDHAFFERLCCKTDRLLHVPEALYWQTQGRSGQITADGSARILQQFDVLAVMKTVIEGSDKSGKHEGFEQIASRLIFERSKAITDPVQRQDFLEKARLFFAEHQLTYQDAWDPGMSRSFGLSFAAQIPLSVIIPSDGNKQALVRSLEALQNQTLRDFETIVVLDGDADRHQAVAHHITQDYPAVSVLFNGAHGTAAARNRGLSEARGRYVVFLDAGDYLRAPVLHIWTEGMLRNGADYGFSAFTMGRDDAPPHSGLHDSERGRHAHGPLAVSPELAILLHAHPSAKIFRRRFLLDQGIRFPEGLLSSWEFNLRASLLAAECVSFPTTGVIISTDKDCRKEWRRPVHFADIEAAMKRLQENTTDLALLPAGYMRLLVRALWEKINFADFADTEALIAFEKAARRYFQEQGQLPEGLALDPYVGAHLRGIIGLPVKEMAGVGIAG